MMSINDAIQYGRAFKPGDVIVLRSKRPMRREQIEDSMRALKLAYDVTGVKFVLIPSEFDIIEKSDINATK